MTWQPVNALVCVPAATAQNPVVSELCPPGQALMVQQLYAPTHDPAMPTAEHWGFTAVSFSAVVTVWLLAKMLGRILSFVQRV